MARFFFRKHSHSWKTLQPDWKCQPAALQDSQVLHRSLFVSDYDECRHHRRYAPTKSLCQARHSSCSGQVQELWTIPRFRLHYFWSIQDRTSGSKGHLLRNCELNFRQQVQNTLQHQREVGSFFLAKVTSRMLLLKVYLLVWLSQLGQYCHGGAISSISQLKLPICWERREYDHFWSFLNEFHCFCWFFACLWDWNWWPQILKDSRFASFYPHFQHSNSLAMCS